MIPRGPGFLDEDEPEAEPLAARATPAPGLIAPGAAEGAASPPRGPLLLDAEPDAPQRLDLAWMPEVVGTPRTRVGAGFWVAAGLGTIVASWLVLSMASFVLVLLQQSLGLGGVAALVILLGLMVGYAVLLELRAYRSLGTVNRLRDTLRAAETTISVARQEARAWVRQIGAGIPDVDAVDRMLEGATTVAEVRAILRSQVADRLREKARSLGRRAAVEGATLVAICPHPAWDGVIAGGRGLLMIRQVAALYGLRPGFAVTLALVRRVAWTAAETTGLALVSQGLANHALSKLPVIKHVAGALPETGEVATRLYRLAGVAAETCCPVSRRTG